MKTKYKLLISNSAFLIILIVASPVIIMSPMIYDSAGWINPDILMTIILALWTYLPVCIIALIGSIILYKKKREIFAFRFSLLPLLNFLVLIIGVLLMMATGHSSSY